MNGNDVAFQDRNICKVGRYNYDSVPLGIVVYANRHQGSQWGDIDDASVRRCMSLFIDTSRPIH